MRGEALCFETVDLRRMPGFENGGFTVEGLSRKVNLVSGPNGSGKSTLARAMQAVLWKPLPGDREAAVAATVRLGDAALQLDLYAGRVNARLDGESTEPPPVPDRRERYLLALPELLTDTDTAFARQVADEATGGYRIAEAAAALGRQAQPTRGGRERTLARDAESRTEQLRRDARAMAQQREEQELPRLQAELASATRAAEHADLLQRQIRLREATAEAATATEAFAAFDEPVRKLQGDEADRLQSLDAQLDQAAAALEATRTEVEGDEAEIAAAQLPEEGLPDEAWAPLKAAGQQLERLARELETAEQQRAEADAVEAARRAEIGSDLTPEALAELSTAGLGDLSDWLRDGQRLVGLESSLARSEAAFGGDEPPDPAPVRTGLDHLHRWLDAQGQPTSAPIWGAIGVLLAALLAGWALAPSRLEAGWGWGVVAAGIVVAGGLIWLGLRVRRPEAGGTWREAYGATSQPEPEAWTLEAVTALSAELRERLAAALLEQRRRQAWEQLSGLRDEADKLRESVSATSAALESRYSLTGPPLNLAQYHERLTAWRAARDQVIARTAAWEALQIQESETRAAIAEKLAPLGWPAAESTAEAIEQLDLVRQRRESWQQATRGLAAATRRLEQQSKELATARERLANLFVQLGLEPDDRTGLTRALAELPACRAAKVDQDAKDLALRYAREALSDDEAASDLDSETLRTHLDEARGLAERQRALSEQVGALKEGLRQAERQDEIEQAMAAEEQAWARLAAQRDAEADALITDLLADHLEEQFRAVELPAVLSRAEAIFAELTRGRYRLQLPSSGAARFLARDLEEDRVRELSELSSGNRVQLLLAVRLASIEADEAGGPRPPLWLDEAMGTSDDDRTQAIIDAVATVAESGRQVFYLTAQHDEVQKWQLRYPDAHRVDLAAVRQLQAPAAILEQVTQPEAIPVPGGLSHLEYAATLGVPGLDPWAAAEQAHLWYAFWDPELLHRLMDTYGLGTWARYTERVRTAGLAALDVPDVEHQLAKLRIEILDALLRGWRQGRSKPVDAGVVSRSFFGRRQTLAAVLDLAAECADAETFLDRLTDLDKVGPKAADEMREFLGGEGYLGEGEPLGVEDLTEVGLSAATVALSEGLVGRGDVAWLVARLPRS